MTIQLSLNDVIPRTQIIGAGAQVTFNTDWTVNETTDVVVYQRTEDQEADDQTQLLSSSDYVVELVGSQQNVRVTLLTPAAEGDVITIVRNTPASRTNLYNNTNFTPSMLNMDFGILTMVDQQAQMYDQQSAPHYNLSATFTDNSDIDIDMVLPILTEGQIWRKNNENTAIEAYTLTSSGSPTNAPYVIYEEFNTLTEAFNLGSLSSGLLKQTVTSGVAEPATAVLGQDYYGPGMSDPIGIAEGGTGADNASDARINLGIQIGTNVQAWSASLDALSALNSTGFLAQTGTNTFADRTLTGTTNQISITNGDGVSGSPVFSLPSALILPGTLQLGGLLNTAGNTITNSLANGDLPFSTNGTGLLTLNATQGINGISNDGTLSADSPTLIPTQAAVKAYADTTGGTFQFITPPCRCSTTADLAGYTYNNGAAGVGATLTAGSNGAFSADDVSPSVNQNVLVRLQTNSYENGVYELTTVGDGSNPAVLTRAANYDTPAQIVPGTLIPVVGGTLYGHSIWAEIATVTTIGTDPIVFIEYSQPSNAFVTIATTQSITGAKTFASASLKLAGSSSGSTTLNAAAVASGIISLPATTDTVAVLALAQTLTNKTISGSLNTLTNIGVGSLANGTAGQLITWSSGGTATTVATGTTGQVLLSNGPGQAPTFQTVQGLVGVAPTQQIFTSGSGTYTTPTSPAPVYIKVQMVGAGAGGSGSGIGGGSSSDAESTTFGTSLLECAGGSGATSGGFGGAGGTYTITSPAYGFGMDGGSGGGASFISANQYGATQAQGNTMGGASYFGGAGGSQGSVDPGAGGNASANSGSGGGGAGTSGTTQSQSTGAGGGAGGYLEAYISSPDATYDYSVGAGTSGGVASAYGNNGGTGADGIIIITEYYS